MIFDCEKLTNIELVTRLGSFKVGAGVVVQVVPAKVKMGWQTPVAGEAESMRQERTAKSKMEGKVWLKLDDCAYLVMICEK